MSALLKFARGNAKLGKHVHTFSLPSGHTCPGALECLSKADKETGKLTDGKFNRFRCFSASQENQYPLVRAARWHNFDLLRKAKTCDNMLDLIHKSIAALHNPTVIRIHVAGDFFNQSYFQAWAMIAATHSKMKFYAYTKSLPFWVDNLTHLGNGHKDTYYNRNFILTASRGGKHDSMIDYYGLRAAEVVFSLEQAKMKNLEIDHDDSHAQKFGNSFALLLHGKQPAGSEASKAQSVLKSNGYTGYSKDTKFSLPTI